MLGARFILTSLCLAAVGAAIAPTASAGCHYSWTGCLDCPEDGRCESDIIGTIVGIVVSGDDEEGEPDEPSLNAAVVQAQRSGRTGHVWLNFTWEDASASNNPVPLIISFSGDVQWPEDTQDNFTFDGDEQRQYEFTAQGAGHRHIPFRITAHEGTAQEETLEGVFKVDPPVRRGFTPWPAAAAFVLLGVAFLLRRR